MTTGHARLAAQLYTVREFTQTPDGLASTLERVRAIGYTAVQLSAIGPIGVDQVRSMLDDAGLVACNTHVPFDRLQHDLPVVIDEHRTLRCRHLAVGSIDRVYRADGAAGYRRFAHEAEEIGRRLADAGMTFSYHHHGFEFERFPGTPGTALEIIFGETEPRYVQAELDTYWIQYGGGDPVWWIRRMERRMPVVHLKDMAIQRNEQIMTEVGTGNLNWPAILDACRAARVEWYAVEQDVCQRDPFESLAISYANLALMGVE